MSAVSGNGASNQVATTIHHAGDLPLSDEYWSNTPNDPRKGFDFQEEYAIHALLILEENQELAFEVKIDKIDDVVIKIIDNESKEETYSFKQFKRVDSDVKTVAWRDLSETHFVGYWMTKKQPHRLSSANSVTIGEISFSTNIRINQDDEKNYFDQVKPSSQWHSLLATASSSPARFKFNANGINEIKPKIQNPNGLASPQEIDDYLKLLVFDVGLPDIEGVRKINKAMVKIYFPFCSNFYEKVKPKIIELFKQTRQVAITKLHNNRSIKETRYFTKWATRAMRQNTFENLIPSLKGEINLGFVPVCDTKLAASCMKLKLDHLDMEVVRKKSSWFSFIENSLNSCYTGDERQNASKKLLTLFSLNTGMTLLKAYSLIKATSLLNRSLFVQVQNKAECENVTKYFKELSKELCPFKTTPRQTFCFFVEIPSKNAQRDRERQEITSNFSKFFSSDVQDLREWIQFVIVTHSCNTDVDEGEQEDDEPLAWDDLPPVTREILSCKKLRIANNITTSLKQLQLVESSVQDWITPEAVAELITCKENGDLSFPVPTFDEELNSIYIKRKLKLPCIDGTKNNSDQIKAVCSREGDDGALIWSRDGANFEDIKQIITPSEHSSAEIAEGVLLQDQVTFGSGSDNRLAIVVDYPGKGKTSLLINLSNKYIMENKTETDLLFHVNLPAAGPRFDGYKYCNEIKAVNFLVDHLLGCQSRHLVAAILKVLFTIKSQLSVFLLLDGFDEIDQEKRKITCEVVEQLLLLSPGIKRIILASRPDDGLTSFLESRFKRFVLHLKDFDEDDQISYFQKQWLDKLGKEHQENESTLDKITEFAKNLVLNSTKLLGDEARTFLGVPLQCFIFCNVFFEQLMCYLEDGVFPAFEGESYTLLELYRKFFDEKLKIVRFEKAKMRDEENANDIALVLINFNADAISRVLKRLAVFHLFDKTTAEALCRKTWAVYRARQFRQDLEISTKIGLLKEMKTSQRMIDLAHPDIRFIHKTFAEYFAALFFFENIHQRSEILDGNSADEATLSAFIRAICDKSAIKRFLNQMFESFKVEGQINDERRSPFEHRVSLPIMQEKWPLLFHEKMNDYMLKLLHSQESTYHSEKRTFLVRLYQSPMIDTDNSWLILCLKSHITQEEKIYPLLNLFQYYSIFNTYDEEKKHQERQKVFDNFVNICSELFDLSGRNEKDHSSKGPIQDMKPILKLLMPENAHIMHKLFGKEFKNLDSPTSFFTLCGLVLMYELKNVCVEHKLSHSQFVEAFKLASSTKMQCFHTIARYIIAWANDSHIQPFKHFIKNNDVNGAIEEFMKRNVNPWLTNEVTKSYNTVLLLFRFIWQESIMNCWYKLPEF